MASGAASDADEAADEAEARDEAVVWDTASELGVVVVADDFEAAARG